MAALGVAWMAWLFSAASPKAPVASGIPHTFSNAEREVIEQQVEAKARAQFEKELRERLAAEAAKWESRESELADRLEASQEHASQADKDLAAARAAAQAAAEREAQTGTPDSASAEALAAAVTRADAVRMERDALAASIEALAEEKRESLAEVERLHGAAALRGIQAIVSAELLRKEAARVAEGAQRALDAFCGATASFPLDYSDGAPRPAAEDAAFELYDARETGIHAPGARCVGVGSPGDAVVPVTAYLLDDPATAERVASQAVRDLRNTTTALVGHALRRDGFSVHADPGVASTVEPRPPCCGRILFGLHPVFGAFYRLLLPVVTPQGDASTVPLCFRRRWWPQPAAAGVMPRGAPLLGLFNVSDDEVQDGTDEARIAEAEVLGAGSKRLERQPLQPADAAIQQREPAPSAAPLTVVVPFRSRFLARLPTLLRSLARSAVLAGMADARVTVALARLDDHPFLSATTVRARVEAAAAAATEALGMRVDVVTSAVLEAGPAAENDGATATKLRAAAVRHVGARALAPASGAMSALAEALGGLGPSDPVLLLDPTAYRVSPASLADAADMAVPGFAVWAPVTGSAAPAGGGDDDDAAGAMPLLEGGWDGPAAGVDPTGGIAGEAAPAGNGSVADPAFWLAGRRSAGGRRRARRLRGGAAADEAGAEANVTVRANAPQAGAGDDDVHDDDGQAGLGGGGSADYDDGMGPTDATRDEAHGIDGAVVTGLPARHATVAAAAGDLALLLATEAGLSGAGIAELEPGPECLGRRLLARAERVGLTVQRPSALAVLVTAEAAGECPCEHGAEMDGYAPAHCERAWVRAVAGDPADVDRVECGLEQIGRTPDIMVGEAGAPGAGAATSPVGHPAAVADRTVRRFDPSLGMGITVALRSPVSGFEGVFDLQFALSQKAWHCTGC